MLKLLFERGIGLWVMVWWLSQVVFEVFICVLRLRLEWIVSVMWCVFCVFL